MEEHTKIQIQIRESRIALAAGGVSIVFAFFILLMYLLHPKKDGGGFFLYLPLLLMLASGVAFFVIYYNKKLLVEEMDICYVNLFGKTRQFTLDEIGFCKIDMGGGKAALSLYDLLGNKLCKLDFDMPGMGEFLQYLVDNRVKIEWNREQKRGREMMIPDLILYETAVCEEEINKCAADFYEEAGKCFRDWEKRNKKFEVQWEIGFAQYREEDLKKKGQAWERMSSLDEEMLEIPEDYTCVLEAYLKRGNEYIVNRKGEEVAVQIPYLVRCRSYQVGEKNRIRKSDEKVVIEGIRSYLEMLSKELPRRKYRTEAYVLKHKLWKDAGLGAKEIVR